MVDLAVLKRIEAADPDGWTDVRPSPREYAEHEAWAIGTYGRAAWVAYMRGGWAPGPESE